MHRLINLPLIVLLMGTAALAMFIPALHAINIGDARLAKVFVQSGLLFVFITVILGLALLNYRPRSLARSHLAGLVAAYTLLPLMLAVPFHQGVQTTTYMNAWFEMVSSFTTTGATLFEPERLAPSLHLWRALVGWLGGFLAWVSAFALMAPMSLGGFEVISTERVGMGARAGRRPGIAGAAGGADPRERLFGVATRLFPVYLGLTVILWIALLTAGETRLTAVCHAMSTLSTSGISPIGGLEGSASGLVGEAMIFLFFAFAISRLTFSWALQRPTRGTLLTDPEVLIGAGLIVLLPSLLFLRHWIGALEVNMMEDFGSALNALWGAVFTVASFLTTAGFVSSEWDVASAWSGLQTPGMVLLGLGLIGGGVATTAGGVKLLRVFALYKQSSREMERLIYPSSVGGAGRAGRRIRKQGAYVAWIFFMLFAISIAVVSSVLAFVDVPFDESLVMTIAALSTTGPAANVALDHAVPYAGLGDPAKVILGLAMALGRLETLVVLALFNPQFWRR
ncbi:TrkH family potassium uptake protein [Tropicimonas sp. IMCC34043]|uniref:TrkH family potassium uptake protein n=1 Tax=Tropicimonas sp. IMCC34043 TaxID=2248760 RepID=UPI000E28403A|nr:potassium transporter TrkG [Tropicimonas sp. IMCC34043]